VTFLTPSNEEVYYDIHDFLVKNLQEVPPELANHPATRVKPGNY
jgi:hypothetical protein